VTGDWRSCCACCGSDDDGDRDLHVHHLIPASQGGDDSLTVVLCSECHGRTHEVQFPTNHRDLTKAGLAKAKAQGVKLGNPKIGTIESGRAKRTQIANERAANILPIIDAIRAAGVTTLIGVADALNARGLRTARGNMWSATEVSRTLARRPLRTSRRGGGTAISALRRDDPTLESGLIGFCDLT
jgi:hypothetical protein